MGNSALSSRTAKNHVEDDDSNLPRQQTTKSTDAKKFIEAAVKRKNWNEVIDWLVKHSLSVHSMTSNNPLDLAIQWNCPLDVIKTVISLEPTKAFDVTNAKKQSALHLALKYEREFEIIQYFCDESPEALSESDLDGNIPLHCALSQKTHFDILQYLLEKAPDTVRNRTKIGGYPLHVALEHQQPEQVILFLIDAYPPAMQYSALGYYPIHIACKQAYSIRVVEKILTGCSDAAMLCGPDSYLPLHYAAMTNKSSLEVIQTLLKLHPNAVLHRSKKGNMPLHLALEHRWQESKLLVLIRACPEAVKQRGRGTPGDFPLSIAIEFRASTSVLDELLLLYPQACEHMNVYRMYLLRSAVRAKVHWRIVEKILEAYPNAAGERDTSSRRLALHYAVSRSYPLSLVSKLIAAYPPGVSAGDAHGLLPIHIAATRAGYLAITRDQSRTFLPHGTSFSETAEETSSEQKDMPVDADCCPGSIEARLDYDVKLFRILVMRFPESVTALDKYGLSPINYMIENTQVLHQDQSNSGTVMSQVGIALLRILCDHDVHRHLSPHQRKIVRIGNEAPLDPTAFKSAFVPIAVTSKMNPLHHVILCNRNADYVRAVLSYDPSLAAATALDDKKQTALHAAIARCMSTPCLLAILEAAPDAVRVRNQEEFLPIHFAIMFRAERIVVQRILMLFPEVTAWLDEPVHVAGAKKGIPVCTEDSHLPHLAPLPDSSRPTTGAYPGMMPGATTLQVDRDGYSQPTEKNMKRIVAEGGHFTLFHFALHYSIDKAILADILSYTMPYKPVTAESLAQRALAGGQEHPDDQFCWQEGHGYLWYDLICHTYDQYPDTINVLFDDYHYTTRIIQLLCDFPNRHLPSRVTLSMATPRCHEQLICRLYFYQRFAWMPPRRDDHVDIVVEDQQTSVSLSNQKEILSFYHRSKYAMCKIAFDHQHHYHSLSGSETVDLDENDASSSIHSSHQAPQRQQSTRGAFGYRRFQPRKVMLKFTRQRSTFDTEVTVRKNMLVQITRRVEEEWALIEAQRKKSNKIVKKMGETENDSMENDSDAERDDDEETENEDDEESEDNLDDENSYSSLSKSKSKKSKKSELTAGKQQHQKSSELDEVTSQFSRVQAQLEQEDEVRGVEWKHNRVQSLLRQYFLELIAAYNGDTDTEYRAELQRQRFVQEYPYLLVTSYVSRSLQDILVHDHPLVRLQREWQSQSFPSALTWQQLGVYHTRVHDILTDLSEAVYFLHTLGYVHTNINPMDVYEMRDYQKPSGFRLVLGNFGFMKRAKEEDPAQQQAAQAVHVSQEIANLYSLNDMLDVQAGDFLDNRAFGYMAPELARCYLLTLASPTEADGMDPGTSNTGEVSIAVAANAEAWQQNHTADSASASSRAATHDRPENDRAIKSIRLDAKYALDVWSLGAIAYQLGSGETLLNLSFDQRIDRDQLQLLAEWAPAVKERRLARLGHHVWLRNLAQQWLSAEELQRSDINFILQRHPFFIATEATQTPLLSTNITGFGNDFSMATIRQEVSSDAAPAPSTPSVPAIRYLPQVPVYDFYVAFNHSHFLYDTQQREGRSRKVLSMDQRDKSIRSNDQKHLQSLTEALRSYCSDIKLTGSHDIDEIASSVANLTGTSISTDTSSFSTSTQVKNPVPAQVILDFSHRNKTPLRYESLPPFIKDAAASTQSSAGNPAASTAQKMPNSYSEKKKVIKTKNMGQQVTIPKATADVQACLTRILSKQSQAKTGLIILSRHGINHPAEIDERMDPLSISTLNLSRLVKSSPLYLFLFELVLMIELHSRGWFENGLYLLVAGDNVSKMENSVVFGSFFESYTPSVDVNDPIYVPPNPDNPLDNSTMIRHSGNCFPISSTIASCQVQSIRLAVQTTLEIHGLGKSLRYPQLTIRDLFLQILLPLPTVTFPVLHLLGPMSTAYHRLGLDLLRLTHPTLPLYRHLDSRGRWSTGSQSNRGSRATSRQSVRSATHRARMPHRNNSGSGTTQLLMSGYESNLRQAVDANVSGLTPTFQKMLDMRVPSPGFHLHSQLVSEHWFEDREPIMPRTAIGSRPTSRLCLHSSQKQLRPVEEENLRPISPQHFTTVSDITASHVRAPVYSPGSKGLDTRSPTATTADANREGGGTLTAPSYRDSAQNAEVLILDNGNSHTLEGGAPPYFIQSNASPHAMSAMQLPKMFRGNLLLESASSAAAPYFTELVENQQQQNIDMLRFCVEKTESKTNEVNNLKLELSLLHEHLRLQQMEILRLRNLVQVTSIRELPPTYIEDDDVQEKEEEEGALGEGNDEVDADREQDGYDY